MEAAESPVARITVGKSSQANGYIAPKEAETPSFPANESHLDKIKVKSLNIKFEEYKN